jgi:sugar phosphate isomerase/epimerase
MIPQNSTVAPLTRRNFLALSRALPLAAVAASASVPAARAATQASRPSSKYPIGLELYSVRGELLRNLPDTLRAVAGMGYEVVEFYAPYTAWTLPFAKGVRTQLDDLGLRCYSTHNPATSIFPGELRDRAIELNQILGTRHLIVSSPPRNTTTLAAWKTVCQQFTQAVEDLKPHGLWAGYHNHATEWKTLEGGQRVMDVIAANTPPEFILQLDVGTAVESGADPVAWIKANPGRIKSIHLKDWAPGEKAAEKSYRVLFNEGAAPWKQIVAAAEAVGGVEFYLIEQEGSRFPEFETAQRCLDNWKKFRAGA